MRFWVAESEFHCSPYQRKRFEGCLFKALELSRPLRKIDLGQLMLRQDYFRKGKLFSALKRNSRVKAISMFRTLEHSEEECVEKSLRYLKEIRSFQYQFYWNSLMNHRNCCEYPLQYLRYCSKLQRLLIGSKTRSLCFKKLSKDFPSAWRKNFAIKQLLFDRTLPSSASKSLNELTSVYFAIFPQVQYEPQKACMTFIQELPNLQEIDLEFKDSPSGYEISKVLQKITEKSTLNKVKLHLSLCFPNLDKVLEAFHYSRLTSFSLKVCLIENRPPPSLVGFLRRMSQLECLKLDFTIVDYLSFNETVDPYDELCEICNQIVKLEALRHLKFTFNSLKPITRKNQRISNFLPRLYPIFSKLESLSLSCNQLDHSEAFLGLIDALQTPQTSLQKLKLDIGAPAYNQKSHKITVRFVKTLSNIKVLKLPCFAVNSNQSLQQIMEAVLGLKSLEIFAMGEIHKNVEVPVYLQTIRTILCKRGLRKFHCLTIEALWEKICKEIRNYQEEHYQDMKKIQKANSSLEYVSLSPYDQGSKITCEILKWYAEEKNYCDLFFPF